MLEFEKRWSKPTQVGPVSCGDKGEGSPSFVHVCKEAQPIHTLNSMESEPVTHGQPKILS